MKTKKRPTKRRKKATVSLATGDIVGVASGVPGYTYWYPTLPPRKSTWIVRAKEALRRVFA